MKEEDIEWLYDVYDTVYDYNYHYKLKEKIDPVIKEDIVAYNKLQSLFWGNEGKSKGTKVRGEKYENIRKCLKKR